MDRSTALSPLKAGEARLPCTAGLAVRGQIRRAAIRFGVDYYEEKGWVESAFILRGPANNVIQFKNALDKAFGDN